MPLHWKEEREEESLYTLPPLSVPRSLSPRSCPHSLLESDGQCPPRHRDRHCDRKIRSVAPDRSTLNLYLCCDDSFLAAAKTESQWTRPRTRGRYCFLRSPSRTITTGFSWKKDVVRLLLAGSLCLVTFRLRGGVNGFAPPRPLHWVRHSQHHHNDAESSESDRFTRRFLPLYDAPRPDPPPDSFPPTPEPNGGGGGPGPRPPQAAPPTPSSPSSPSAHRRFLEQAHQLFVSASGGGGSGGSMGLGFGGGLGGANHSRTTISYDGPPPFRRATEAAVVVHPPPQQVHRNGRSDPHGSQNGVNGDVNGAVNGRVNGAYNATTTTVTAPTTTAGIRQASVLPPVAPEVSHWVGLVNPRPVNGHREEKEEKQVEENKEAGTSARRRDSRRLGSTASANGASHSPGDGRDAYDDPDGDPDDEHHPLPRGPAVTSTSSASGARNATSAAAAVAAAHHQNIHHNIHNHNSNNNNQNNQIVTGIDPYWVREFSVYDLQQIDQYWDKLLPTVNYLGTERVAKIYQALCVAYRAHRGQMRKSGEPFIIHPVEVSLLLSNLRMDGETVIAGLLHDTVEDTELTFDQVEALFGTTVRRIVEGETKVSKLPKLAFTDYADEQAENLRQMFVAMTDDYRIIIVKLADRLHNMRTLRHMKPEKQVKISRETLDIFAPLAHRMGIWQFKSELEDTAFMYLYPLEYKRLNRRLRQHQTKFRLTLDKSQEILQRQLDNDLTLQQQAGKVEVFGRTKEIYSLWHKMETKGERNLENIVDVVALRVIITPKYDATKDDEHRSDRGVWLCYHVLGLVQHLPGFQPVPTKVKDYISFPKPNGYQSLHTALNLNGQTIEVQIRTSMMHQVAEYGMASHWLYTDTKRRNRSELYNTPWLSSIKEWQNDRISSRDFVDSVRRELLGKRVFVFLRNGKILNLARGATAIDAAFQIHTEVGLNMHGVQINGKSVPFSYELQNGDVVSILTGDGRPSTDWMRFAKSRSTRSKLRAYFRARQMESLREAGRIILMDYLTLHSSIVEQNSFLDQRFQVPRTVAELIKFLPGKSRFREVDDLLIAIGKHHDRSVLHKTISQLFAVPKKILVAADEAKPSLVPSNVVAQVHDRWRYAGTAGEVADRSESPNGARVNGDGSVGLNIPTNPMLDKLTGELEYADPEQLCEHCLPVHGDQIIGTRPPDNDSITTVHRMGCPHAQRAINQAAGDRKQRSISASIQNNSTSPTEALPKANNVDSVSLRYGRAWKTSHSKLAHATPDIPAPLEWSDLDDAGALFLTEVVVLAQDRKLLLADCSEVVSDAAEIMKTGSSSTDEHASLIFLVKVTGLDQLQDLMDRLGRIRSVMSVERRFGSELL